jgi:hypothetical protein
VPKNALQNDGLEIADDDYSATSIFGVRDLGISVLG